MVWYWDIGRREFCCFEVVWRLNTKGWRINEESSRLDIECWILMVI